MVLVLSSATGLAFLHLLVQIEHALHPADYAVVAGHVGGVGEVDGGLLNP